MSSEVAPPGIFITEAEPAARGVALAVKDLFDTAGVRTTYGSAIFADHVPAVTAEAVRRLEAAGYTTIGKANLHEFAWGITSDNPHYGLVPNPLAPDRTAGGSSGGCAAALAARLADAALGSDSGGSVRIPAAFCGVAGFKPSFGLVPTEGCFPLAPSFDHVGPMANDVSGCERMMQALVPGFAPSELGSLAELNVGIAWTDDADPLVRERVEHAARLFPHRHAVTVPTMRDTAPLFSSEAAGVHADLWREHRDVYGENVAYKLELAMQLTDEEVESAARARALYREQFPELMQGLDLVLTPTVPIIPPPARVDERQVRARVLRCTYAWNVIGAPALAMPCGRAEHGLPASIQLVGAPGDDGLVLAAGRLLELALASSGATRQAAAARTSSRRSATAR